VLVVVEEEEILVLNLEAEASGVAKMMEAKVAVAAGGVGLVEKVATKVYVSSLPLGLMFVSLISGETNLSQTCWQAGAMAVAETDLSHGRMPLFKACNCVAYIA
jgi:hypothetical protein